MKEDQEFIDRFESKFTKGSNCWEWQYALSGKGYGVIKYKGKGYGAHRVSYFLYKGDIPEEIFVCHKCDNPKCVNPNHLFLGTNSENMKDCYAKGRMTMPSTSRFKTGHFGINRELLDVDTLCLAIINRKQAGNSLVHIAKQFGVKYQTIRDISSGRSYSNDYNRILKSGADLDLTGS